MLASFVIPASKAGVSPSTRAAIAAAIRANRGLCCTIAPIVLRSVRVSHDGRFALAYIEGGNALEGPAVVLWHGIRRWAAIDYGTGDGIGCGRLPDAVIDELFAAGGSDECRGLIAGAPRLRTISATVTDPWIVDRNRSERLISFRVLRTISSRSRFAAVLVRVKKGRQIVVRYALLWRGTAWWAVIDVQRDPRRVGCGLVSPHDREVVGFENACS